MSLVLKRPLVVFDLETTGVDPVLDRIVEIAILRLEPDGSQTEWVKRVNPGVTIPKGAVEVHGISNEDVANCPTFEAIAPRVDELFRGADVAGYNSTRFDLPLLIEEFARVGVAFDLSGRAYLDAMTIFTKMEPRTLTAAYAKFCGKELMGAHGALADAIATKEVLFAQVDYYNELPQTVEELGAFCLGRDHADLVGRLAYDSDGEVVYKFGKYKGRRVKEIFDLDPSYLEWIIGANFPTPTKQMLIAMYNEHRLKN